MGARAIRMTAERYTELQEKARALHPAAVIMPKVNVVPKLPKATQSYPNRLTADQELAALGVPAEVLAAKPKRHVCLPWVEGCVLLMLPWPPSVNHYWERNANGTMRIGPKGICFRSEVAAIATRQRGINGRLEVEIIASPPDKRCRDLDNVLKATLDALQHAGVYVDDNQIDRLLIQRGRPVNGGSLLVRVRPCP